MTTQNTLELRLPVSGYRSLPIPGHSHNGNDSKLGNCFVKASDMPAEFADWMEVNPRKPQVKASKKSEQSQLTHTVARKIVKTLQDDPGQMAIRNQGIYIIVDHVEQAKEAGGQEVLTLRLSDPENHGLVNGGHTYFAVRQVYHDSPEPPDEDAWVRVHILQNIDPDNLIELADGLNRSFQVKDRDLANLGDYFQPIKDAMEGKKGAEEIVYAQGDPGSVEVEEVLIRLSMLNLNWYPDKNKHPNAMFAAKTGVVKRFASLDETDATTGKMKFGEFELVPYGEKQRPQLRETSGFSVLIPNTHEILCLWENIYARTDPYFGLLGKQKGKQGKQAPKPKPAVFAEGVTIPRKIAEALPHPIFAAMRANIDPEAWKNGEFKWRCDVDEVLDATIEQMCRIVRDEYDRTGQPRKPAEVGKRVSAYRPCYQEVALFLLEKEMEEGRH